VKDASNGSVRDVSDAVFTIKPYITVLTPNGGESSARCSAYNITWATGGTSGVFKLEYSVDGGSTWSLISNNIGCGSNACSYGWTLPNIVNSQIKVRVSDAADATKMDVSDASMSSTLPASPVRLLSPNGGETWVSGTSQNITYTYGSGTTQVSLDYSVDSLATWTNIVSSATANGSYAWTVPNVPSSKVFVRVTGNQYNGCDYDVSDARFTIASSVVVTSPNGGESWQATVGNQGSNISMSNATLVLNTANYVNASGGNVSYTQTLVPDNPLNKLAINFTSLNIGWNSNYPAYSHLYIYDGPVASGTPVRDFTNSSSLGSYQSTHSSGSLTLKYVYDGRPGTTSSWNGYVTSVGTSTKNITWNIVGTSKYFDIDYSQDGGNAWTRVVSNLPNTNGVYAWQVPNTPTTQGRVRVRDAGNNVIVDSSDANFTITAATPVFILTSPNGGEVLYPNTTTTIKWYDGFVSNSVALEYSIDNGANWLPIISSYANTLICSSLLLKNIPKVNIGYGDMNGLVFGCILLSVLLLIINVFRRIYKTKAIDISQKIKLHQQFKVKLT
jgi:hypothetical protein